MNSLRIKIKNPQGVLCVYDTHKLKPYDQSRRFPYVSSERQAQYKETLSD